MLRRPWKTFVSSAEHIIRRSGSTLQGNLTKFQLDLIRVQDILICGFCVDNFIFILIIFKI
jgi:hypothetical protein